MSTFDELGGRRLLLMVGYAGPWERPAGWLLKIGRDGRQRGEIPDGSWRERLAAFCDRRDWHWRERYARSGRQPHPRWARR